MCFAAFLVAIRDEPSSDVPRLVCADWLEDDGQPDRAEFIRIQIELTHGVRERPRTLELLRRLYALFTLHRDAWLGPLAAHAEDPVFDRGFVEQAVLPAAALLAHAAAIFDLHPIFRLGLRAVSAHAPDIAGCPQLAHITALDLRETYVGDHGLGALGESPHLGQLRCLDMTQSNCTGPGLRRLVAGGGLRGLQRLVLRGNAVGITGAEALASTPNLPALRELDLSAARVTDRAAQALAESANLSGLQTLVVSHNPLGEAGVRALLASPQLVGMSRLEAYGTEMQAEERGRIRSEFRGRVAC